MTENPGEDDSLATPESSCAHDAAAEQESPRELLVEQAWRMNSLKIWDAVSGAAIREIKAYKEKEAEKGHKDSIFAAAFSPDGKLLASASGGQERVIKLWNVADGNLVRELDNPTLKKALGQKEAQSHPGWIYGLCFSKDGNQLISVGNAPKNKGYIGVWNVADGKLLANEEPALGSFFSVALSPDGAMLAVGAGPRGRPTPGFNSAYLLKLPKGN